MDQKQHEIDAGELADLVQNQRHYVPMKYAYNDLGRRFVLQYPYTELHVSLFPSSFTGSLS